MDSEYKQILKPEASQTSYSFSQYFWHVDVGKAMILTIQMN
jgi:hypothetical protein